MSKTFTRGLAAMLLGAMAIPSAVQAQQSRSGLTQPVFRVAKNNDRPAPKGHPLDAALKRAESGLINIRKNIKDYECMLVAREQVNGVLGEHQYMYTKVRTRKTQNGKIVSPLSVYMYFVKPNKGREVLYVEGVNKSKLCVRDSGVRGLVGKVWLDPNGRLAMAGQRYPISEVGIENLIVKLLEKGTRDRKHGECDVQFHPKTTINGRTCTMIQVTHPYPRPHFEFHIARIFIDDELNIPIRYAAYEWPKKPGEKPPLLEEYTYLKMKLNKQFKNIEFDSENPNYFVRK